MKNTKRVVAALAGIGLAASLSACSSEDTAQASADYLNWFTHLLNLAAQLNPSGKAGGDGWVWFCAEGRYWKASSLRGKPDIAGVFETIEAAQKARDILNASGGKLAGVPCPFIKS